jgi:hypothetical protein
MADFTPQARAKNGLDNNKLNLSVPCPADPSKKSSLIWGFHANNPRLTVYTNVPDDQGADKGYGKISANLDMPVFFGFLHLLNQTIAHVGEIKNKIENKNFIFPGGKRSERPVVVSELWVGKDADGVVWLSVTAKDRPKIKFTFGTSDFHKFVHGDGTPFTDGEMSVAFASGYVNILEKMMTNMAVSHYVEPVKKDNGGGKGNWNNNQNQNRGGNSGGGRSAPASDMSDDIPW